VSDTTTTALAAVERRLGLYFQQTTERAWQHSTHYAQLWDALRSSVEGGKRLRPRLLIATYLELGGSRIEPVIELASAIELLHSALLCHDDVIDGDVERRGALNVAGRLAQDARAAGLDERAAERWGQTGAILAGDLLLTSAVRMAGELDLPTDPRSRIAELMDESIYRAAAGELADVAYGLGLSSPTVGDIHDMMADKTAHYSLELPLRAAAILAGAPWQLEQRIGAIGSAIGVLFQLRDDALGVFGHPATTGKSTSTDLREGKQTMLIAFARNSSAWGAAARDFGNPDLDELAAHRLREALESSGARQRLEEEIVRRRDGVIELIRAAELPRGLAALLATEAELAVERVA
jgi:geranylgeranyl diphosphate synthase type II